MNNILFNALKLHFANGNTAWRCFEIISKEPQSAEHSVWLALRVSYCYHILASNFDMGVTTTKIWTFCTGCFGSQQGLSSKLIWLLNALLQNWQRVLTENDLVLWCQLLQIVCLSSGSSPAHFSSWASAFLPNSHAGSCCSLLISVCTLISAPWQRCLCPCSLFVSPELGFSTTAQYSALINLQFSLLRTLFSYSSLSLTLPKEKHWQENSMKVHTENEMVIHLLCIFWQQSFF